MGLFNIVQKGYYTVYLNSVLQPEKFIKQPKANAYAVSVGLECYKNNPDSNIKIEILPPKSEIKLDMSYLLQIQNGDISSNTTPSTPIATTSPKLYDFEVKNNNDDRVYFKSTTKLISGTTITGFTVSNALVTNVSIDSNGLGGYFVIDKTRSGDEFNWWKNNTIRYEGGSDFVGSGSFILHPFTLTHIQNNISKPIASIKKYVNVTSSGTGDGSSKTNEATVAYMNANAQLGETWWIKAGDYTNQNINIVNSGTVALPIVLEGYKDNENDITTNYYTPLTDNWSSAEMPTFTGSGRSTGGNGIEINNKDFIIIKNLQFTNYEWAFWTINSTGIVYENVNAKQIGDIAGYQSGFSFYGGFTDANQDAHEPSLSRIINSNIKNASGNGIANYSDGFLVENCTIYANEGATLAESMDYHLIGQGNNNIYTNNHVERTDASVHTSYMGLKSDNVTHWSKTTTNNVPSRYNLFDGNTTVKIGRALKARNVGVDYNVFKNNSVTGFGYGTSQIGAISIWSGKYNIWEKNTISNCSTFIEIYNNGESVTNAKVADGNIIRNNLFNTAYYAIASVNVDGSNSMTFQNNKIYNNTFINVDNLFFLNNGNGNAHVYSGNELKNNNFIDFNIFQRTNVSYVDATPTRWLLQSNNTWDGWLTNGTAITGTGNISVDPQVDANYKLTATSPATITEGGQTLADVIYDYEGNLRTNPYSIGYTEYGVSAPIIFTYISYNIVSQDENSTSSRTFFNKDWNFSKRESEDINNMGSWGTPVNGSYNNGDGTFSHLQSFTTKYFQIKGIEEGTLNEIILDIQTNPLK